MNSPAANPLKLLDPADCLLVIIDIQKHMQVMAEKEKVLENVMRLAKFAQIFKLPVVLTEQENLGPTAAELKAELPAIDPIHKITFDCFGQDQFRAALEPYKGKTLVMAGIEAHICIAQTALTAMNDFQVHVVADAVASRTTLNRDLALARLSRIGATITSTEMFVYELLKQAGTDEFRAVLRLVK